MKMKCKCGNTTFYGHQEVRMQVIVDEDGDFVANKEDIAESIYEAGDPYGNFICTNCGQLFDDNGNPM